MSKSAKRASRDVDRTMPLLWRALGYALAVVPCSCALFPSLDELTAHNAASDGGSDASTSDAGSWSYISSVGQVLRTTTSMTLKTGHPVMAGDLIIVGSDTNPALTVSLAAASTAILTNRVGPYLQSPNAAVIYWGIAPASIDGLPMSVTITVNGNADELDGAINVYRGGSAAAKLVDSIANHGPSGIASCGPVATVPRTTSRSGPGASANRTASSRSDGPTTEIPLETSCPRRERPRRATSPTA